MSDKYRAILTTSQGRPGWILSFKHPHATGPDGKHLPKVRRGLKTTNESEAKGLCDQMNRLLEDPSLWPLEAKSIAIEQGFDERVIRIFYDGFPAPVRDSWETRETQIPLPSKREKIRKTIPTIQLLGITGSCKTTLVRQLIGTYAERFPSISNSRTTTCDMEIIVDAGKYSSVVTFLPRAVVQQHIEECARNGIFKFITSGKLDELIRKFLEHDDQRFRLKYTLGDLPYDEPEKHFDLGQNVDKQHLLEYRRDAAVLLQTFVDRLRSFADQARDLAERKAGAPYALLSSENQLAFEEEVDDYLEMNEAFEQFVEEVLQAVEERFRFVEVQGSLSRDDDGWPSYWCFEHDDQTSFLRAINFFTSNHAERFGTLLTPLVDGIRVKGPFKADWLPDVGRWVILDGEGLGHTPDSTSAVPLRITKRYDLADAIVLTDRSDSSMQAASVAVLKSLISSGHESKLIVCFTKFDTTRDDDSRPRLRDRQNSLLNSFDSTVSEITGELDQQPGIRLSNSLAERVFYLEDLNRGDEIPNFTRVELLRLNDTVRKLARPSEPITARPIYDLAFLPFTIQGAAKEFHSRWQARLGLQVNPKYKPEHWSRIKALSKYSMRLDPTGYSDLMPVDDFASTLERHVSSFLQNPIAWNMDDITAEETAAAVSAVKRQVHTLLTGLAVRRMIQEQAERWKSAYQRRGPGSTGPRARDIEALYNIVVPIPDQTPELQSSLFMQTLRDLVRNAILFAKGQVVAETDASLAVQTLASQSTELP